MCIYTEIRWHVFIFKSIITKAESVIEHILFEYNCATLSSIPPCKTDGNIFHQFIWSKYDLFFPCHFYILMGTLPKIPLFGCNIRQEYTEDEKKQVHGGVKGDPHLPVLP